MAENRIAVPQRKRGAQPGNKNAIKHGFYSRYYRRRELSDLDLQAAAMDDRQALAEEIAMLKILIRRVLELNEGETSLGEAIDILTALSLAANRMANMIKVQKTIFGDESSYSVLLQKALEEAARRLGIT
jgi:uncharacterized protein YjcR